VARAAPQPVTGIVARSCGADWRRGTFIAAMAFRTGSSAAGGWRGGSFEKITGGFGIAEPTRFCVGGL